jgi:hypothetical protein
MASSPEVPFGLQARVARIERLLGATPQFPSREAADRWFADICARFERGEISEDDAPAILKTIERLNAEAETESAETVRTLALLKGRGTDHGRAPLNRTCGCSVCVRPDLRADESFQARIDRMAREVLAFDPVMKAKVEARQ